MSKLRDSIIRVKSKNEYLIFYIDEPFYLMELLEDYNKNYIYEHYCDSRDKILMLKNDYVGNLMKEIGYIGYVRVCDRCGCEVVFEKELVSYESENDYKCACLCCDEDLWYIETDLVKDDEHHVTYKFTDGDKDYYIKHECLPSKTIELLEEKVSWL